MQSEWLELSTFSSTVEDHHSQAGVGIHEPWCETPIAPVPERIIEVDVATKEIVWQYGTTGFSGNGPNQLNNPNCAELLENGHILICDENNNRAIEVTRTKQIMWQYGSGDPNINDPVSGVAFASRLENGHTLIHARLITSTDVQESNGSTFEHRTYRPTCSLTGFAGA